MLIELRFKSNGKKVTVNFDRVEYFTADGSVDSSQGTFIQFQAEEQYVIVEETYVQIRQKLVPYDQP